MAAEGFSDRVAQVVGDLDSPFYAEERQRDVWNEASAVGLQSMLWLSLVLACAMSWIGGREQAPWVIALLVVVSVASLITVSYAQRRGVSGLEDARLARARMALFGVLYAAIIAGLVVRSGTALPSGLAVALGCAFGGGALLGLLATLWRKDR